MRNLTLARALTCQVLDHYARSRGIEGNLSDIDVARASEEFVRHAASPEVRIMLDEHLWQRIDTHAADGDTCAMKHHLERFMRIYIGAEPDEDVILDAESIGEAIAYLQNRVREDFWDGDDDTGR